MTLHLSPIDANPSSCSKKELNTVTGNSFHERKVTGCQSIIKMLEQVMLQVNYDYFADRHLNRIDPLYRELCLIIAEVLVLDQDLTIKINGSNMSARLVQEVYSQLRNDHVCLVFSNFRNVSERVFNKKSYLRTALYNVVFEIESHYTNDIRITY